MTCKPLDQIVYLFAPPTIVTRVRWQAWTLRSYDRLASVRPSVSTAFVRHCVVLVTWPVVRPTLALEYTHHPPLPAAPAEPAGVTSR